MRGILIGPVTSILILALLISACSKSRRCHSPPASSSRCLAPGDIEYAEIPVDHLIEFKTMPGESYELLVQNAK